MTLTDFLLARIADDEAATRILDCNCGEGVAEVDPLPGCPDRVLAECEAKRTLVMTFEGHLDGGDGYAAAAVIALEALALPYADHPDYNPDWRP